MSLTQVPGRDDGFVYEGVQNNPHVGDVLDPVDIVVDDEFVRDYINATGDETYWAFRAATQAKFGVDAAPLTLFDRDIGARLVGISSRFALHAKQGFTFHGPVLPGREYRLTGKMIDVSNKNGIDYFTTRCECVAVEDPSTVLLESDYIRAYRFPNNQYPQGRQGKSARLSDWLQSADALPRESFPNRGAIVEGRTRLLDQARLNLYSGPGSGVHTDNMLARQGGLRGTVGQALMLTQLESELYRDLFGFEFYSRGSMWSSFIAVIPVGVEVRAVCVVDNIDEDGIKLKAAVATTAGDLLSVSRATMRDWP